MKRHHTRIIRFLLLPALAAAGRKRRKSMFALFAACLILLGSSLFPALPVHAAGGGTGLAMQLVNVANPGGGIEKKDRVYFGWINAGSVYEYGEPNRTDEVPYWRVLDSVNTNMTRNGSPVPGMFMLSDELIGSVSFFDQAGRSNAWQGSSAQGWCERFLDDVLESEKKAILKTTKSDPAFIGGLIGFSAPDNILNEEKVFFLSAEEADKYFDDDADRAANFGREPAAWWLRSAVSETDNTVGIVGGDGQLGIADIGSPFYNRPAFNLDLSKVLFTCAAAFDKFTGTCGGEEIVGGSAGSGGEPQAGSGGEPQAGSINPIGEYTGKDWKLTLIDESRKNFRAYFDGFDPDTPSSIRISYEGATTKNNDYISVIVTEDNEIRFYGPVKSLKKGEESGTITIPTEGFDTIYVINEQINGGYLTDFSSELQEISIGWSVEITAGAHMSKTSGEASQFVGVGASMTAVEFTAASGYYFPENYGDQYPDNDNSGVRVRRDSQSKITVYGKPEGNVSLTLSDAVIIKPLSDNMLTLNKASYEYDGAQHTPELTVKDGDVLLAENTDYVVDTTAQTSEQAVGNYTITISGKGGYSGSASTGWSIVDTTAPVISGVTNGETYQNAVSFEAADLRLNTVTLQKDSETAQTLTVENGKASGTASKPGTYTLTAKDLSGNETAVSFTIEAPVYSVTESSDTEWTQGSSADLTITVKRSFGDDTCFSHFEEVLVDGAALTADDYSAAARSAFCLAAVTVCLSALCWIRMTRS